MNKKVVGGRKADNVSAALLGDIAALIPTSSKPKGKATKWEMELSDEARQDAERWASAKAVLEPVEKRVENAKNDFIEYALDVMVQKLFANKSKASNPIVVLTKTDGTVDHQFQVMLTDKFKYRFPEVPEGVSARQHFIDVFVNVGLHPSDAENLVDNELDFMPITGFRSLTELLEGHYGEGREWIEATEADKEAGKKFAALLMWNGTDEAPEALTPQEKALVITRSPGMQVKAGFYDRVATYCQCKEQLHGIFKVIQPIIYPSYLKFALNDSETAKTARKIQAAADILGTGTVEE